MNFSYSFIISKTFSLFQPPVNNLSKRKQIKKRSIRDETVFYFIKNVNYKHDGKLQSHHVSSDKTQSQKKQADEMCIIPSSVLS